MTGKRGFHILIGSLFLAGAATGLYFQFSCHKFLNYDALSYINIAELYTKGDWAHAINGYWSPLYCWVLSLCQLAGMPLQGACYVINFIAAGCCLFLVLQIAGRYITEPLIYYLFGFFALGFLLFYAMSVLTPDLTGTALCLWFLLLITDEQYASSRQMPYTAGIVGACMYFAKSYHFAILHLFFVAYILVLLVRKSNPLLQRLRPLVKTYAVFLLLSLVWITILSIHEKKITFATSGRFNHNLGNPGYNGAIPVNVALYPPPFEGAYFAHINPAHMLDAYDWLPFENSRSFFHQLNIVSRSASDFYNILDSHGVRTVLLFAMLLFLLYNRKKVAVSKQEAPATLLLFFIVYPLLYLPILILDRYVFVCTLLFHFFLFYIASLVWKLLPQKPLLMAGLVVLAAGLVPLVMTGKKKLTGSCSEYRYYKAFYSRLPDMAYLKNQRIASAGDAGLESVQLCYHLNCRYYCVWSDGQYNPLKQYNIRYILARKEQAPSPFLVLKEKMPVNNATLFIYEVK